MKKTGGARARTDFGGRMWAAREHAGLTQADVKKTLGVSQSTVSGLERSATSSGDVVEYAKLYKVDPGWLSNGDEPSPDWYRQSDKSSTPERGNVTRIRGGIAHPLIQLRHTLTPPLQWEDLMSATLPEVFSLVLHDESMAPHAPAGTVITFSRSVAPESGFSVLLTDKDGNFYFRVFKKKTPTHWQAVPLNSDFLPLDSNDDGLTVVGVMTDRQISGNSL